MAGLYSQPGCNIFTPLLGSKASLEDGDVDGGEYNL